MRPPPAPPRPPHTQTPGSIVRPPAHTNARSGSALASPPHWQILAAAAARALHDRCAPALAVDLAQGDNLGPGGPI